MNDNKSTEHPGRNDQQRKGETNASGNNRDGKQKTLDAWEKNESVPINSEAAAAAFNMLGSKFTGGETDRP